MSEYEEKIKCTFKEIGFKVAPSQVTDSMYTVLNKEDEFTGYLIVNDGFCTIGNGMYSILFHDAEIYMDQGVLGERGLRLFSDKKYVGSINL